MKKFDGNGDACERSLQPPRFYLIEEVERIQHSSRLCERCNSELERCECGCPKCGCKACQQVGAAVSSTASRLGRSPESLAEEIRHDLIAYGIDSRESDS